MSLRIQCGPDWFANRVQCSSQTEFKMVREPSPVRFANRFGLGSITYKMQTANCGSADFTKV
jgi:hypothetical protein